IVEQLQGRIAALEEDSQLAELRTQGCSSVQGFLFARPMDVTAVAALLGLNHPTRTVDQKVA
ncbi:MAG TPA: hypothetical protein VF637_12995, partial [Sphingomicrobium sp.]